MFTLMEDVVLRRMISKVGWTDGEGVLAPGKCQVFFLQVSSGV